MGMEEEGVARGGGGKKLALASIGFADVRVGAVAGGGGAGAGGGYKEDLLVVGLPKDDDFDVAKVVGDVAVGLPDVGAAVRVRGGTQILASGGSGILDVLETVWAANLQACFV